MRIGDLAERTGLTTRTIRYYEQIGLLPPNRDRERGKHRQYDEADVDQLELIRALTTLMGCSLEEVQAVVRPELAVAVSDLRWGPLGSVAERLQVVETALSAVDALLERVRARREELEALELQLEDRLAMIESRRVIGA